MVIVCNIIQGIAGEKCVCCVDVEREADTKICNKAFSRELELKVSIKFCGDILKSFAKTRFGNLLTDWRQRTVVIGQIGLMVEKPQ